MASQLDLKAQWAGEGPAPEPSTARPAIDPRDADLLSGPQVLRSRLLDACAALDAAGVRAAYAELQAKFLGQSWAARALEWSDVIEGLAAGSTEERAARVQALADNPGAQLSDAPEDVVRAVLRGALCQAARALLAEHGPAAELADGRAAAEPLALAEDWREATDALRRACEVKPTGSWFITLADAAARADEPALSLEAWCRACLHCPEDVPVDRIGAAEVTGLLDEAEELELSEPIAAWVPVLAAAKGLLRLEPAWIPEGDGGPLGAARWVSRYQAERSRLSPEERIAAKRELLRVAPQLKALARGLRELGSTIPTIIVARVEPSRSPRVGSPGATNRFRTSHNECGYCGTESKPWRPSHQTVAPRGWSARLGGRCSQSARSHRHVARPPASAIATGVTYGRGGGGASGPVPTSGSTTPPPNTQRGAGCGQGRQPPSPSSSHTAGHA